MRAAAFCQSSLIFVTVGRNRPKPVGRPKHNSGNFWETCHETNSLCERRLSVLSAVCGVVQAEPIPLAVIYGTDAGVDIASYETPTPLTGQDGLGVGVYQEVQALNQYGYIYSNVGPAYGYGWGAPVTGVAMNGVVGNQFFGYGVLAGTSRVYNYQTAPTWQAGDYAFTVSLANRTGIPLDAADSITLEIGYNDGAGNFTAIGSSAPVLVANLPNDGKGNYTGFADYTATGTLTADQAKAITAPLLQYEIWTTSAAGGGRLGIDNLRNFTPAPEPSTLVLLGSGLLGLLAYAWRKRSNGGKQ